MYGENSLNRLNASLAGAIEEIDLNFETSSIEDAENLRVEIEKLRAMTEDQILKLRQEYLKQELELLKEIDNENEKKLIIESRPECLFIDSTSISLEDLKNFEFFGEKETSKRLPWASPIDDNILRSKKHNEIDPVDMENQEKSKSSIRNHLDEEVADLEYRIKLEMEAEFRQHEKDITREYEEKMENAVSEVEIKLNQYWESRAEELEEKIKAVEEGKNKPIKNLDQKYQEYYEELLEKEKESLAEELEGQIREKYENLLQQELNNSSGLDYETEKQIREEMEYAFQQRLRDEKQA